MGLEDCTALGPFLKTVPDPRDNQGKRYTWMYLLTLLCLGLLNGQKTPYAIYRWAKWHEDRLVKLLMPARGCVPGKMTFYRALQLVDVDALEESVTKYGEMVIRWLSLWSEAEEKRAQLGVP